MHVHRQSTPRRSTSHRLGGSASPAVKPLWQEQALLAAGRAPDAVEQLRLSLQLQPDSQQTRRLLAQALQRVPPAR